MTGTKMIINFNRVIEIRKRSEKVLLNKLLSRLESFPNCSPERSQIKDPIRKEGFLEAITLVKEIISDEFDKIEVSKL